MPILARVAPRPTINTRKGLGTSGPAEARKLPSAAKWRAVAAPVSQPYDLDASERRVGLDRAALSGPTRNIVQAKLQIGSVSDPLEQEADRMAAHVVDGAPRPALTSSTIRSGVVQRRCAKCTSDEDNDLVQRKGYSNGSVTGARIGSSFSEDVQHELSLGGRRLDPATTSAMERGFGTNFSGVRLHEGARAAALAQQVRARAFTIGTDIFFNRGELRPEQADGRRLLAHELTHCLQQGGAGGVIRRKNLNCYAGDYVWSPETLPAPKLKPTTMKTAVSYDRHAESVAIHEGKNDPQKFLWSPTTPDFAAVAARASGDSYGARDLIDIVVGTMLVGDGELTTLRILGHGLGMGSELSMSGTVKPSYVTQSDQDTAAFDEPTLQAAIVRGNSNGISPDSIESYMQNSPDWVAKARAKFARNGRVVLFACNAGADGKLACALQRLFGVPVYASAEETAICAPVIKDRAPPDVSTVKKTANGSLPMNAGSIIDESTRGLSIGTDASKMKTCTPRTLDDGMRSLMKFDASTCILVRKAHERAAKQAAERDEDGS